MSFKLTYANELYMNYIQGLGQHKSDDDEPKMIRYFCEHSLWGIWGYKQKKNIANKINELVKTTNVKKKHF